MHPTATGSATLRLPAVGDSGVVKLRAMCRVLILLNGMITSLAYVVFWLSAVAALISSLTLLHRLNWTPYWVAALLSLLVGAVFGIVMVECFVRLHSINERFE